jgi:hypothetical protein
MILKDLLNLFLNNSDELFDIPFALKVKLFIISLLQTRIKIHVE